MEAGEASAAASRQHPGSAPRLRSGSRSGGRAPCSPLVADSPRREPEQVAGPGAHSPARFPARCPSPAPGGGVGARRSRDSQPLALPKDWERREPAHFQMAQAGSRTGARARLGGSESARQTNTKEEAAKATGIGAGCWVQRSHLSPDGERRSPLGDPDVCQVSRSYRSALRDVSFPTSGLGQVLFSSCLSDPWPVASRGNAAPPGV